MNIYIPKHIRKLEVVGKMCDLIEAYNNSGMYVDNTNSSFENYYYYLKTDPVIKFLHFRIPESEHTREDYESIISYVARLFYSVKGTSKVFDFMKKYLDLDINYKYSVKNLTLTISEVTLVDIDEKVFYDSLVDFLSALLYFREVTIKIELINLWLSNKLKNYTRAKVITYKAYTTEIYEN